MLFYRRAARNDLSAAAAEPVDVPACHITIPLGNVGREEGVSGTGPIRKDRQTVKIRWKVDGVVCRERKLHSMVLKNFKIL